MPRCSRHHCRADAVGIDVQVHDRRNPGVQSLTRVFLCEKHIAASPRAKRFPVRNIQPCRGNVQSPLS